MEFNPDNDIVKLCLRGTGFEERGEIQEARRLFLEAWREATWGFEKFISAHFLARSQGDASERLNWLETALKLALDMNDDAVRSALPPLHSAIAGCHEELGDHEKAKSYRRLAISCEEEPSEKGPFYHGTKADLKAGDLLTAGGTSNYQPELRMNHVYFTALVGGAGLAASLARGDGPERVYRVEPTGPFEDDPNVTNKKFPGNLTRSYRSLAPLKIVGEVADWHRQTSEQLRVWRAKLASGNGKIIN